MKYKLIIDKSAEEEIVVTVHAPSSLTQAIEDLVSQYFIWGSFAGVLDAGHRGRNPLSRLHGFLLFRAGSFELHVFHGRSLVLV